MDPNIKRQIWQSIGQFLVVFVTGMLVFKDVHEVMVLGVMNAIYQPMLQAILSALGIFGISRIAAKGNS